MDISKNTILPKHGLGNPDQPVQMAGMAHPAVQIYVWVCLTLAAQMLSAYALTPLALMLAVFSFKICPARFFLLLRRTRWILFSVFLIYAYTSPGDLAWPQLGAFSPVADGITGGLLQIMRLVTVLAGLAILLTLLSQSQLITGLYTLSRPLRLFGLSRERVAVRLALTLRYAESAMQGTASNWRVSIEQMLAPVQVAPGFIELHVYPFSGRDWLLLVAVSVALLGTCLPGGVWL
jgi:hypothetical protein